MEGACHSKDLIVYDISPKVRWTTKGVVGKLGTSTFLRNVKCSVSKLIIYMKKFLHADWLRASQLIPNSAKP